MIVILHALRPVAQIAAAAVTLFASKCAAFDASELEETLGEAVLVSLQRARITVKEAAALMAIDESQLRHGLRNEAGYHLSLNRLVKLPFSFWLTFSPTLTYLVAKKHTAEIAEDLGLSKRA